MIARPFPITFKGKRAGKRYRVKAFRSDAAVTLFEAFIPSTATFTLPYAPVLGSSVKVMVDGVAANVSIGVNGTIIIEADEPMDVLKVSYVRWVAAWEEAKS